MEMDFRILGEDSFRNEMHERFSLHKYQEPGVSHAYSVHVSRFDKPSLNTPPHNALLSLINFTPNCLLGIFEYLPHEMNFHTSPPSFLPWRRYTAMSLLKFLYGMPGVVLEDLLWYHPGMCL